MTIRNLLSAVVLFSFTLPAHAAYQVPPDADVLQNIEAGQTTDTLPNNFNMLIWNVHKGEDKDAWAFDLLRFKSYNAILLQEAMIDDYMPGVLRALNPLQTIFATSFAKTDENYLTGVSTSLSTKSESIMFRRSPVTEPFTDTPKMSLLNIVRLENGNPLLIINIHGINFVTNSSFRKQIYELVPFIQRFPGSVIFAGDFNTWNWGRSAFLKEQLELLGLSEVEFQNDNRVVALDHAYARGCIALHAEVLSQIVTSDHDPLTISWSCQ